MHREALCDTSISEFRHLPSGNASARSASKSMTPATKRRWRRCEMPWAREILNPPGPRTPPCLPTRRSPTRGAARPRRTQTTGQRLGIASTSTADVAPTAKQGGLPVAAGLVEVGDAAHHQPARDLFGGFAG